MKIKNKKDTWKQGSPKDQLVVLLNSLRGELESVAERCGRTKTLSRANQWVEEIELLGNFLPKDSWE